MAKHSPSPWRAGKLDPFSVVSSKDAMGCGDGALVCESVQPKNRPLIIAAPDLLEALCDCPDPSNYIGDPGGYVADASRWYYATRKAAIAKVEGG